jgi:hypothetical protein
MMCIDCTHCKHCHPVSILIDGYRTTHRCDRTDRVWFTVTFMPPEQTPDCGSGELKESEDA